MQKSFLLSFALGFASLPAFSAPVVVAYFTKEPAATFETKIKPVFEEQTKTCKDCQLRNLTPYKSDGTYDPAALTETLKKLPAEVSFVFIDWNERSRDQNREIAEVLSSKSAEGKVVVASAGVPPTNEGTCPLTQTLMGKVSGALIIGELEERDRLRAQCFYGPEMLSAIRPPKDRIGQGLAPLYFVSRLATSWERRKPADWEPYLKARKARSKNLWPELEEFFPR